MRTWSSLIASIIMICCTSVALAQSPEGVWTTIDDKTGKKRSEVRLSIKNHELSGQVIRVYAQDGDTGMCKACPGKFKNQPIKGLQFIWGLKEDKHGAWVDGEILDPKSGKIYSAKILQRGNKLYVRGYVGFALLGRTQVWVR